MPIKHTYTYWSLLLKASFALLLVTPIQVHSADKERLHHEQAHQTVWIRDKKNVVTKITLGPVAGQGVFKSAIPITESPNKDDKKLVLMVPNETKKNAEKTRWDEGEWERLVDEEEKRATALRTIRVHAPDTNPVEVFEDQKLQKKLYLAYTCTNFSALEQQKECVLLIKDYIYGGDKWYHKGLPKFPCLGIQTNTEDLENIPFSFWFDMVTQGLEDIRNLVYAGHGHFIRDKHDTLNLLVLPKGVYRIYCCDLSDDFSVSDQKQKSNEESLSYIVPIFLNAVFEDALWRIFGKRFQSSSGITTTSKDGISQAIKDKLEEIKDKLLELTVQSQTWPPKFHLLRIARAHQVKEIDKKLLKGHPNREELLRRLSETNDTIFWFRLEKHRLRRENTKIKKKLQGAINKEQYKLTKAKRKSVRLRDELADAKRKSTRLEKELARTRGTLLKELKTVRNENVKLKMQLEDTQEELTENKGKLIRLQGQRKATRATLTNIEEEDSLRDSHATLVSEKRELERRNQVLKDKNKEQNELLEKEKSSNKTSTALIPCCLALACVAALGVWFIMEKPKAQAATPAHKS